MGAAVKLVEHDPAWPAQAAALIAALTAPFAGSTAQLEPIGSTAVPGLCAKPVLDLLLGVPRLADIEARIPALQALGWRYRPEHEAVIPARRYFVREPVAGWPRAHLNGVVFGGALWRQHLGFRDALRASPALCDAYAALKQRLAAEHALDKAAYQDAKAPFIRQVLASLPP
jgi:GrpB-like predicted nucleotidyltransferase (UPF0157 family)